MIPIRDIVKSNVSTRRLVIGAALTLVFLVLAARLFAAHRDELAQVRLSHPAFLFATACALFANLSFRVLFLCGLVRKFGTRIGLKECALLVGATNLLAVVTLPAAGVGYRAWYLRSRHDLRLSEFASIMGFFGVVWLSSSALLGIGGAWLLLARGADVPGHYFWALAALSLIIVVPLPLCYAARSIRLPAVLKRFVDAFQAAARSPKMTLIALGAVWGCSLSQILAIYFTFQAFGLPAGIAAAVILCASIQLGAVVGLTPGGIGFQESVALFFAAVLGIDMSDTFLTLVVIRMTSLAVAVLCGVPSMLAVPAPHTEESTRNESTLAEVEPAVGG
jgi:uncharacterized membrane protein YbhN (UPF0104 family)